MRLQPMLRSLTAPAMRPVWLILALALLIRVVVIFAATDYRLAGDSTEYDRQALSLAHGDGFPESEIAASGGPTAIRNPAYPILLGAVYAVSGDSRRAGQLVQALLGTAVVALIGVLAWQIWRRRVALWAMATGAVAPPLIVAGVPLLSEPLFLLFELSSIAAVIQHSRSDRRYAWAVAAGLLIGLAALTRSQGVLLAPVLGLALWTGAPRLSRAALAAPAALVAATLLMISPWAVRNAIEFDAFVPLSTQSLALARNYNDAARTDPDLPSMPHDIPEYIAVTQDPTLDEAEVDSELRSRSRDYMLDHPGYVALTVARNTERAIHLDPSLSRLTARGDGIDDRGLTDAGIYGFYLLAGLALVGAILPTARRMPWFVWVGPLMVVLPALLIAAGRTRYRAPLDPVLVMLACVALTHLWDLVRGQAAIGFRQGQR